MRINKLQLISKLLPAVAFIFIGSVTQGATIVLGQSLKCFKDNICKKKLYTKNQYNIHNLFSSTKCQSDRLPILGD